MVQGIVESEPNGYPRLPVVCRVQCKKNGSPNCPTKKVDILHGIRIEPILVWSIPCVPRV